MNPDNYCSLWAAKRLVEAGIVLETENAWVRVSMKNIPDEYELVYQGLLEFDADLIPAPSMAEVWRELPDSCGINSLSACKGPGGTVACYGWNSAEVTFFSNVNPTDALVDLLIWVRKEAKDAN